MPDESTTQGQGTTRKLPGLMKYNNVVLKRGWTKDRWLWNWRKQVIDGKTQRASGAIVRDHAQARWVARSFSGVKRTSVGQATMSAYDPKRTLTSGVWTGLAVWSAGAAMSARISRRSRRNKPRLKYLVDANDLIPQTCTEYPPSTAIAAPVMKFEAG